MWPFFAKASKGILLRTEADESPAKRVSAKQDGAGSRGRTCMANGRRGLGPLRLPFRHARVSLAGVEPARLAAAGFEPAAYPVPPQGRIESQS